MPVLKRAATSSSDKQLAYRAGMAGARCAMALQERSEALQFLAGMTRSFPRDPDVLYFSARYLSQLANGAAQELVNTAPNSTQAQKLKAEALEGQGKQEEALAAYRHILETDPHSPEIHFRIGQILLNAAPPDPAQARHEFEAELKNDPNNASAEFMIGELARRDGEWNEAINHFEHAAKLDAGFLEAYLALGMSLNSAGKFADALPPLERYVKLAPADPAGHYQLAMAYARTGNKEAAARESELQRKAAEKATGNIH